jgi:hypothetical protein
VSIYNRFVRELRLQAFWVAIIDVDEFLVPVSGRSVPNILQALEAFPGITINWVVYGTNGKLHREPGLVMERFRNHAVWNHPATYFSKVIVNPRHVTRCDVHDHYYVGGAPSVNVLGAPNGMWLFARVPVHSVLRINHYWLKSRDEFVAKRSRGISIRDDPGEIRKLINRVDQDIAETPDVISDSTIDWAIPIVKERLDERRRIAVGASTLTPEIQASPGYSNASLYARDADSNGSALLV